LPDIDTVIPVKINGGNHAPPFTKAFRTPEAHKTCFNVSPGFAATSLRLLMDDTLFAEVKLLDHM
jgi:hypothetical protein